MSSGRIRVVIDWVGFENHHAAVIAVCEALDDFNDVNEGLELYWIDDEEYSE